MRQMKPLHKANMVLSFNKSIFNYYFIERRYSRHLRSGPYFTDVISVDLHFLQP